MGGVGGIEYIERIGGLLNTDRLFSTLPFPAVDRTLCTGLGSAEVGVEGVGPEEDEEEGTAATRKGREMVVTSIACLSIDFSGISCGKKLRIASNGRCVGSGPCDCSGVSFDSRLARGAVVLRALEESKEVRRRDDETREGRFG